MLIENATNSQTAVHFKPYSGIVNPEHTNQINCVPVVHADDADRNESNNLKTIYVQDFIRKAEEFRNSEHVNSLPIEIRLGTVYVYQNQRQQTQYPNNQLCRHVSAQELRNEEYRPRKEKDFLITFNKNKGITDIQMFQHGLTCAGFRLTDDDQITYRLYLRYRTRRLVLELKRNTNDQRSFSVKRILKYSTKYTHIDVVKSKTNSNFPGMFDDIFDIRTSIGKIEEEELHINDQYCNFIHIKDLEQCVMETQLKTGELIYQFNRSLVPYFDYFQIKRTMIYDYCCMDSQFFGVRVSMEHQIGYDLCSNSRVTSPCIKTKNVIMAKLVSSDFSEDEAQRIFVIGTWLSELATKCTYGTLPNEQILMFQPSCANSYRQAIR